ncbi:MAG: DNA cytosine methyltransferase [Oscillospiraceae bacterium]|nr:DNA cytosine methyltransferase [Oscillospiraceae bacterium]
MSQIDIFDEIIVDNFAGGGGASTGIELAAGRPVAIAINHDPDAILLHKTNHPYTEHLQASVWDVDPVEVCKGRPVGLAWFSPDCKHFSKAKGAALRDRKIRGLAWIVLRWAGTVRPRVIMLENVEEFQTWGPVRKGKPVKKHSGKTFKQFIKQLEELGYVVEYRELIAADYGAPTTRKRFALIARCDGKPIVWPERTHAPRDSEEVKTGQLKPWRSAAEIIDWTLPNYSIFDSKQEIKERYGVNAIRPLADNTLRRVIRGVDKFTIKSGKPFIVQQKFANAAQSVDRPLTTVTAVGSHEVARPIMAPFTFSNTGGSVGSAANEPVHTIRSAGGQVLSAANLIQYHTEQTEKVRGQSVRDPIQTVDAANRYGLASAQLVEYYGNGNPLDAVQPLHTVTAHDREAVVCAHIDKYFNGEYKGCGDRVGDPLSTVTALPRHGLCSAHVVKFKGQELGQHPTDTLNTITAQGLEYAECRAVLAKVEQGRDLGRWPQIRELLNKYCGYDLKEDEIILLIIRGIAYFIADITLRMLTPRELYNAMGFPVDYQIEKDYMGNAYGKNKQVARCGNAVCPPLAEAMVRANFPEWGVGKLDTMAQFHNAVAV